MRNRILVVGFALMSAFAVAQSGNTKTAAAASSDGKKGEAQLKVTPEKMEAGSENIKKVSTPVKTSGSSAQPMASDDWQQRNASPSGTGSTAASGSSEVKAPRDSATGMASGKRQHQPVTLKTDEQQKTAPEKK
jgi:hypothetical protein